MTTESISFRSTLTILGAALLVAVQIFLPVTIVSGQNTKRNANSRSAAELIRDPSIELVRVKINGPNDSARIRSFGPILEDYGSFVVVARKKGAAAIAAFESQRIETEISLPGTRFEPLIKEPATTVRAGDAVDAEGYYIVQFGGIVRDEWLDELRATGAEVIQYVPHQAFFVFASGEAAATIAGQAKVRWVGRYTADQKISRETESFAARAKNGRAMFDVAVFKRAELMGTKNAVADAINGRVIDEINLPSNFFNVIRIEANADDVQKIAEIPDVFRIDQYERPVAEDERAAQIVAGNYTSTTVLSPAGYNPLAQFGVDGTGVTVAVADDGVSIPGNGGFYLTATNTVNGPLRGAAAGATGGHGHLNASIIAGNTPFGTLDPTGYNYGLGIAPKANIINIPFLVSGNTTTDAQSFDDTLTTLGPNGVRGTISNNSWGNGTNANAYDSYTAMYDGFVLDASLAASIDPMMIVFSAGNSGPGAGTLTRPKVSKNTISVANSENIRTELGTTNADNMDDLRSSSSRGPAADGRIKPDITAPGSYVAGSRAGTCGSVTSCFDANHAYSIGTSHAAPQVAGAAALFTQYWRNVNSGADPKPSLIKAAVINTGKEMNGLTTSASTIPNGNEGWGRINLKNMFNTGVPMKYVNETLIFETPGQNVVYSGTVANASKPFRVSLVWTDPPGTADPALVNNLDLTVTVGANTYRGNVFSGGNSTTGGSSSTIDNVENVFLPAGIPAGTPVTITVAATALNGNGVLGNADATDQHFSLVGYNFAEPQTGGTTRVDFDGDSKTDISIFRPGVAEWWINRSSNGQTVAAQFGASTDIPVPGDFTGDGKADVGFWRPSTGNWFVLRSEDASFFSFPFGTTGDKPLVADFDGDGKVDPAVFRPSTNTWFISKTTGGTTIQTFGATGDKPVPADYDGDNKADIAIYRPAAGEWWIQRSGDNAVYAFQFGLATDLPVAGDYSGDGKDDAAFFRPSNGSWYVLRSENGSFYSVPFGVATDKPVPGDYDGDGKFDPAVFRPSNSTWFVSRSTAGTLIANFGATGDEAIPGYFVP